MIYLIVLLAVLGLILFILLKPKSASRGRIAYTTNLDKRDLTTKEVNSEAKKDD